LLSKNICYDVVSALQLCLQVVQIGSYGAQENASPDNRRQSAGTETIPNVFFKINAVVQIHHLFHQVNVNNGCRWFGLKHGFILAASPQHQDIINANKIEVN
jgi:hypothetical protein